MDLVNSTAFNTFYWSAICQVVWAPASALSVRDMAGSPVRSIGLTPNLCLCARHLTRSYSAYSGHALCVRSHAIIIWATAAALSVSDMAGSPVRSIHLTPGLCVWDVWPEATVPIPAMLSMWGLMWELFKPLLSPSMQGTPQGALSADLCRGQNDIRDFPPYVNSSPHVNSCTECHHPPCVNSCTEVESCNLKTISWSNYSLPCQEVVIFEAVQCLMATFSTNCLTKLELQMIRFLMSLGTFVSWSVLTSFH